MPSIDEIRAVIFDMVPSGSPGLDGFTGRFFRSCSDIVGYDMVRVVQEFFLTGSIHSRLNSNIMALILKTFTTLRVEHYRPISMSNFVFKVIT